MMLALLRDGFHPDSAEGSVGLRGDDTPVLDYRMTDYTWDGIRRAFHTMAEIQFAAGAGKCGRCTATRVARRTCRRRAGSSTACAWRSTARAWAAPTSWAAAPWAKTGRGGRQPRPPSPPAKPVDPRRLAVPYQHRRQPAALGLRSYRATGQRAGRTPGQGLNRRRAGRAPRQPARRHQTYGLRPMARASWPHGHPCATIRFPYETLPGRSDEPSAVPRHLRSHHQGSRRSDRTCFTAFDHVIIAVAASPKKNPCSAWNSGWRWPRRSPSTCRTSRWWASPPAGALRQGAEG